jgi:hydrogenase 3 maturation protease
MLTSSWRAALEAALGRLGAGGQASPPRVAVVGMGQALRGDDGFGCAVAAALQPAAARCPDLLVLDGGPAPENQTGALRRFGPALVIFVDAAQLDAAPGTVRWLPWEQTAGLSNSTHALPIALVARYLSGSLGCEIGLLGIQPEAMTFGAPLTPAVAAAAEAVTAALLAVLLEPRLQHEVPQHH